MQMYTALSKVVAVGLTATLMLSACVTNDSPATKTSTTSTTSNNQYSCNERDGKTSPIDVRLGKHNKSYWFSVVDIKKSNEAKSADNFIENYKSQYAQQQLAEIQKDQYRGQAGVYSIELLRMHKFFSLDIAGMTFDGMKILSYKCTPKS